jgi:ABC-type branched-subunit amino acid transport system permease subunit
MFQLAAALSSLTLVAVTGVKGILGLGPAIFLAAGAVAVGPAGHLLGGLVYSGGGAAGLALAAAALAFLPAVWLAVRPAPVALPAET